MALEPRLWQLPWNVSRLFLFTPLIGSDAFDYLDAPVERVTGADVPMPYAKKLEDHCMVQTDVVVRTVERVCYRKK